MAFQYYNRYTPFQNNGQTSVVPYIPLTTKPSDKIYVYKVGRSRLDKVSQEYYGTPFLNIPYPLITSLQDYKLSVENYFYYYGR